jgi:radical SAM superfamily enzyme YgiQ (UPF0313 family)
MKVILNCLPPARVDTPSAALSILKAHLMKNGIETRVVYWNILLDGVLPPFERDTDTIHFDLLPYLYLIAGEQGDHIAAARANAYVKAELPGRDILNDNSDYLRGAGKVIGERIEEELSRYSPDEGLLFGISCRYEQWIPGMVLAAYVKRLVADAKVVIGGLGSLERAAAVMKLCGLFDFAIWGEGEYPLLELVRALDGGSTGLTAVPRLLFREGGTVRSSDTETGEFFDMNSETFADYDDYFACLEALGRDTGAVILPLESTRGCTWNACRFCVYSDGMRTRKREPARVMEEVRRLLDRYSTPYFAFMDNDIVANDQGRLEKMLDDLISLRGQREINFIAEVIPKGFTKEVMEKLPRAGFGRIHFGYESLSDGLLAKMGKRTNFSDNIFFVKFARKFGITLPSANIICGIPSEEDVDILTCMDNLHFLRFYCNREFFRHTIIPLRLAGHSRFHDMVSAEELARFNENEICRLLPKSMTEGIDRFSLFDFSAPQNTLWNSFAKMNDFYYSHIYSYTIRREEENVVYREFFDGEPVLELVLGDVASGILREANERILDLRDLLTSLRAHRPDTDEASVLAALDALKARHLVYFGEAYGSIISVIDASI